MSAEKGSSRFKAIVMGGSSGGVAAMISILEPLAPDFPIPILAVQHLHPTCDGSLARLLEGAIRLPVLEPCDKEELKPGNVYIAPANYHMLAETDGTIALSVDDRVNWSRPSIDVLFESAARAWPRAVIAVLLSGANSDGTEGMRMIRKAGGLTIAQDPTTAAASVMPRSAIDAGVVDEILKPEIIGKRIAEIALGGRPGIRPKTGASRA